MRPEAKGYILKEYGSWSVLTIAYFIGIGVCRSLAWTLVPLYISLGLLINSKQAFTKWLRKTTDRMSLVIFAGQVIIATAILAAIFQNDVLRLLPLLVFPVAYLVMSRFAGEHFVLTEVLGFTLLSLSAVLAKFLLTNGLDVRLFVGVALYFSIGVFKIKAVLRRKTSDRIQTALSVVGTAFVYRRMHLPIIILLPLVDNLLCAATLYRVRLQTTGWIEVAKSLAFLGLFLYWY